MTPLTNEETGALQRSDAEVGLRRGWNTARCNNGIDWMIPELMELFIQSRDRRIAAACLAAMYQAGSDLGLLTTADARYRAIAGE